MDSDRVEARYIEDIFDTLRFLEINWQIGPKNAEDHDAFYSQRLRLPLYQKALDKLTQTGLVYACDCSRAQIQTRNANGGYDGHCRHRQLPLDKKDVAWRLDTSAADSITVKTPDGSLHADFPDDVRDFVIRKKDGFPAYQLCSVVDDLHFGIDLVIRGQDLWSSTLAQLYLAKQLNEPAFGNITFYHHPLLLDAQKRKLSKSAGDTSIRALRKNENDANAVRQLIQETASQWLPLL